MQKITPFLWFNDKAEEAMEFYKSVFKSVTVKNVSRVGDKVMSASFELEGQEFIALNGGPVYSFTPAISFFIKCETQAEIDEYWEKLTADGGEPGRCGWLKDKYGLSWQVVPPVLMQLMGDKDAAKSQRVVQALMQMNKIEIETLKMAHAGN